MTSPFTLLLPYNIPKNGDITLLLSTLSFSAAILPYKALEDGQLQNTVKSLHDENCAVLMSIDAEIADEAISICQNLQFDGLHLETPENFKEIRAKLDSRYMLGVHVGLSRHDAMTCGEAGAEYIAYGGSNLQANLEYAKWFEEVMTLPGMAWGAGSKEEINKYLAAGSDFVAFGDYLWESNIDLTDTEKLSCLLPSRV